MANLGSSSGIPQNPTSREAREQPEVIHHTYGMGRRGHPKLILGSDGDLATRRLDDTYPHHPVDFAFDKNRFSPSQEDNSFFPSPFDFTSSNQRPESVNVSQSFHSNSVMAVSNIPPNAPPIPYPSVFPHVCHPCRPLFSTSGSFINSTTYPDEGQLERCYPRLPTALCDEKSHGHESYMSDSQTNLVNGHLATLTAPGDSTAVQRALVAPPAVVVAATLRRTPGRPTPHVCRFCEARFTAGHNLKNHIHSHLGLRPHICKRCQRGFVTKHDCRRHEKTCKDIPPLP